MSFATVGPLHCKPITHCGATTVAQWHVALIVFLGFLLNCFSPPPPSLLPFTNPTLIWPDDSRHAARTHRHLAPCSPQPGQRAPGSAGRRGSAPTAHAACQPGDQPCMGSAAAVVFSGRRGLPTLFSQVLQQGLCTQLLRGAGRRPGGLSCFGQHRSLATLRPIPSLLCHDQCRPGDDKEFLGLYQSPSSFLNTYQDAITSSNKARCTSQLFFQNNDIFFPSPR